MKDQHKTDQCEVEETVQEHRVVSAATITAVNLLPTLKKKI